MTDQHTSHGAQDTPPLGVTFPPPPRKPTASQLCLCPRKEQDRAPRPNKQSARTTVRLDLTCLLNGFYQLHQNRGRRLRWGELLCQACQCVTWKGGTGCELSGSMPAGLRLENPRPQGGLSVASYFWFITRKLQAQGQWGTRRTVKAQSRCGSGHPSLRTLGLKAGGWPVPGLPGLHRTCLQNQEVTVQTVSVLGWKRQKSKHRPLHVKCQASTNIHSCTYVALQ